MTFNSFLDPEWQKEHLQKIEKLSWPRYSPELHVDLEISDWFEGISRTKKFYDDVRKIFGEFRRRVKSIGSGLNLDGFMEHYSRLSEVTARIIESLEVIKDYDSIEYVWNQIGSLAEEARGLSLQIFRLLREEMSSYSQERQRTSSGTSAISRSSVDSALHDIGELNKQLDAIHELASSKKAMLSNTRFLLLTGEAGSGKTHLLCDVLKSRFQRDSRLPSVLVFGENFSDAKHPVDQIIRQLKLDMDKDEFIRDLNRAGRETSCRAILAVDAINETPNDGYWKRNLGSLINEVNNHSHIALVISIRSGFEDEVLPKKHQKVFVEGKHEGFGFSEWEAINKFFEVFDLPLPEIPLLRPEFQNPLFLRLFCEAFKKRRKKKGKQVFRGQEGATYIFEAFIDSSSKKLANQFGISKAPKRKIWDAVIERMAAIMVDQHTDRISGSQMEAIVKEAYPNINHEEFLQAIGRNLLVIKIPSYEGQAGTGERFSYRFPFQKFSDHLIGRYIFKKYENEFGKQNKNLETAKKFFSRRRKLGKALGRPWGIGIVDALSVQCPEQLKGIEFVEVIPYLTERYYVKEAFLASLIWRKPSAFPKDIKKTRTLITELILQSGGYFYDYWDVLLSVAPVPDHPLNGDYLHKRLIQFLMPNRDSHWTIFVNNQLNEQGALDRLINWGWSNFPKTQLLTDSVRLTALPLVWFLSSTYKELRDKSTKALVSILSDRLEIVIELLEMFKEVDDPYISERLFAVAYGCAVRSKKDRKGLSDLSKWIFTNVFKDNKPPVHILLRDYARGVIEVALQENVDLPFDVDVIRPPYFSSWPDEVPTKAHLKEKYYDVTTEGGHDYYSVWSSVMYEDGAIADFGNYVVSPNVENWSGRRLGANDVNRRELFNYYKAEVEKIKNRIDSTLSELELNADSDLELQESESELNGDQSIRDLENTLASLEQLFKKEIEPYLDGPYEIKDPLETFNDDIAYRWIFNRVIELGWDPELHYEYDKGINYDRYQAVERIGKKYQWIAFHELLARIADRFEFKDEELYGRTGEYGGPWQISVRDIDPTCLLKSFPNQDPQDHPKFESTEIKRLYSNWNRTIPDSEWLANAEDIPSVEKVLTYEDNRGEIWFALWTHLEWAEETPPEEEEFRVLTRRMWWIIRSYLVHVETKEKVLEWASRQGYRGNWLHEADGFRDVFLGEFPWAKSFEYQNNPYHGREGWSQGDGEDPIPAPLMPTRDYYASNGSRSDRSTEDGVSINLPAKYLIDEIDLEQIVPDGRFFNKAKELVAFDPQAFDTSMPDSVLIKRDSLLDFLDTEGLSIIWALQGEKQIIGSSLKADKWPGRLDISGVYSLDDEQEISGKTTGHFKSPRIN